MAKDTVSIAKNKMYRSLVAIYDRHPTKAEKAELWKYFESRCAYCNTDIDPKSRMGHLDHLISSAKAGANNIHNIVLACAHCNGDEKREESWESFLKRKAVSPLTHEARRTKIENWSARSPVTTLNSEFSAEAEAIIKEALENFDFSVKKMRALHLNITY